MDGLDSIRGNADRTNPDHLGKQKKQAGLSMTGLQMMNEYW